MINGIKNREDFINKNLGLVHACAHRFTGKGVEYDDLYSTGCVGLIKAADGFDQNRGVKFSTYAVPVILGEIKRIFRDGGTVKVSRGLKELSLKVTREREKYIKNLGDEPTVAQLAEILSVSKEQVAEAIGVATPIISLSAADDTGGGQIDIKVESIEEQLTGRIALKDAIKLLDELDRNLIILRYFEGKTQSETASILKMTQVQVSRKEKKILTTLRLNLN